MDCQWLSECCIQAGQTCIYASSRELVHNTLEVPEEDDYVHLEFRYNTYGDLSGRWGDEAVSFNLNSVDFEGKKGLKLKLNSAVNDEVEITFNIKETMSVPEAVLNLDYSELEADKVK